VPLESSISQTIIPLFFLGSSSKQLRPIMRVLKQMPPSSYQLVLAEGFQIATKLHVPSLINL
jgi:hypothetical protein